MARYLVTGGAGFIGSAACRYLASNPDNHVVNVDALTYAGNLASLRDLEANDNYVFVQSTITDEDAMFTLMRTHDIEAVMHLAAESHVDRSIDGPDIFIQTNVVGTCRMLAAARRYWEGLTSGRRDGFRFHHISTDEVYGDLPFDTSLFSESTPYSPSSPYSASKAASDHFVRAWHHTYGLPVVLTNCSNNYGPFHFPEKLIPLVILNAIDGLPLPVYGKGDNVRDWLYVEDHVRALETVVTSGTVGETYNIGGRNEQTNLEVVRAICSILDDITPRADGRSFADQITFVTDRPGHDRRYAIDATKIENELGWQAQETFETGLKKTVRWYLENEWWWGPLRQTEARARRGQIRA